MKLFLVIIFAAAVCSQENYDGPEYAPIDASLVILRNEIDSFGKRRAFPRNFFDTRDRRIVGGDEVTPHSHPYQVALLMTMLNENISLCGGSILTTRSILTAGENF